MGTETREPTVLGLDWAELSVAGLGLRVPAKSQYRMDDPCSYAHGSVGGWVRTPDHEAVFTVLWRPLAYWARGRAAREAPDRDPAELHETFLEEAVRRMRRDANAMRTDDRATRPRTVAGHPGQELVANISVRRRMRTHRLHRRQVLWTCECSSRHMAFELSVPDADSPLIALWDQMVPRECHHHGPGGRTTDER